MQFKNILENKRLSPTSNQHPALGDIERRPDDFRNTTILLNRAPSSDQ